MLLGAALIVAGMFGFLPVLGYWMIPIGLAVMFPDAAFVRRAWLRLRLWWKTKRGPNKGGARR